MEKNGKKRVVMISLDAVGKRDMEYLLQKPNFKKIVENGAFCSNVSSVYPSLTYPAHSSIVTGMTPDHHRIVTNTKLQPNNKTPDWRYKEKYIQAKTIVDIAKEKGMKTAAFLWPVMAGAKIDYNIPEVMCTRPYHNQVLLCLKNGTPKFLLEVNNKFGHIRKGISQPALDDFVTASVEYTIDKYDPDFMLIHFTDVDTNRHDYGATGKEITAALDRHDERLGNILKWLEAKRPMDDTTVIVLGDHCQIDAHTITYLNKAFVDKGYITLKNGKVTDYKAITKTCDGSTYVYLNPKKTYTEKFYDEFIDFLNELKKNEALGIEEIYTSDEAKEMGADSDCFCMIEGKEGFYFLDNYDVLTELVNETKNHKMLAIHGCLPTKELNKTFFAAWGKGIKKGARVEEMHLWDEGPTIAKILGGSLGRTDGKLIEDIFE